MKKENHQMKNSLGGCSLSFSDETMEAAFLEEKSFYQIGISKYFIALILLLSVYFWVLNKNPLQIKLFVFNLIKLILICIHLWIMRSHPRKIELSFVCVLIPFVLMSFENFSEGIGGSNTEIDYYLSGIYNEFFCLSGLVLRIEWKRNVVVLLIVNILITLRCFYPDAQLAHGMMPLQIGLANVLFFTGFSFVLEKNERNRFFQMKKKENSLLFFQDFIQQSLPLGVLVFSKKEVLFNNNEVDKLLGLRGEGLKMKNLMALTLEKGNHVQGIAKSPKSIDMNKNLSLYDLLIDIELRGLRNTREITCSLKWGSSQSEDKRFFNARVDRIIWKEEFSTIVLIWDNKNTNKKEIIKEFEVYKDRVLASLSHQFRTPLNGMMGNFNHALECTQDQKIRESLELAIRSSKQLLSLLNDVLDFTNISLGRFFLDVASFPIDDVLENVTEIFQEESKKKGLEFIVERTLQMGNIEKPKIFLRNDKIRLRQVLSNILSNSLKYTENGYIKLKYEIFEEKTENKLEDGGTYASKIKFTVQDSGCGIQDGMLSHLFKTFGKIEEKDFKRLNTDGIGFGLAISQKLLSIMNNRNYEEQQIFVRTELGRGTEVTFELESLGYSVKFNSYQLLQMDEILEKEERIEVSMKNHNFNFNNKQNRVDINDFILPKKQKIINILIVEDDPINTLVLTRYLNTFKDIEYSCAINGAEALKLIDLKAFKEEFFNLALMDCNMPIMDGYETTLKIRDMVFEKEIPDLPVVAVTANVLPSDLKKCLDCGMVDYLAKPFTKRHLREKIDKHFGKA